MTGKKGRSGRKKGTGKYYKMAWARITPQLYDKLKLIQDEPTLSQNIRKAIEIYVQNKTGKKQ